MLCHVQQVSLQTATIAHIAFKSFNAVNDPVHTCTLDKMHQDASRCMTFKDFVSPFDNGWGWVRWDWLSIVTLPAPVVPLSRCGRVLGNYLLDLWHIHPSLCGNLLYMVNWGLGLNKKNMFKRTLVWQIMADSFWWIGLMWPARLVARGCCMTSCLSYGLKFEALF